MSDPTIVYRYTPEALAEPGYLPDVPPRDLTDRDLAMMPPDIEREVRGCKAYTAVDEARAVEDAAATGQPVPQITVGEDVPPDLLTPEEQGALIEQAEDAAEAAVQAEAAAPKKTKKGGE